MGREQLSEAVIGYYNLEHAQRFKKLFRRPYFRVTLLPDPVSKEPTVAGNGCRVVATRESYIGRGMPACLRLCVDG